MITAEFMLIAALGTGFVFGFMVSLLFKDK